MAIRYTIILVDPVTCIKMPKSPKPAHRLVTISNETLEIEFPRLVVQFYAAYMKHVCSFNTKYINFPLASYKTTTPSQTITIIMAPRIVCENTIANSVYTNQAENAPHTTMEIVSPAFFSGLFVFICSYRFCAVPHPNVYVSDTIRTISVSISISI